jgi:hypothetical protein
MERCQLGGTYWITDVRSFALRCSPHCDTQQALYLMPLLLLVERNLSDLTGWNNNER